MGINDLYQIADQFRETFGSSLWDFMDQWTGFDLLKFEEVFCPSDLEGSINQHISATYGKEAAELIKDCIGLGNFQKICSTIGAEVIPGQRKYLGTTFSKILIPVVHRYDNTKPIQVKEIEGYVLGCLAVSKNGDYWNLQHLPSGHTAGKYLCKPKQAISKMKLALSFEGIDQKTPSQDCLEKLKKL